MHNKRFLIFRRFPYLSYFLASVSSSHSGGRGHSLKWWVLSIILLLSIFTFIETAYFTCVHNRSVLFYPHCLESGTGGPVFICLSTFIPKPNESQLLSFDILTAIIIFGELHFILQFHSHDLQWTKHLITCFELGVEWKPVSPCARNINH